MSYIHKHILVVEKLINEYKSSLPFSIYLKDYFSKNKKHGSKDRKSIAHLSYTYFRLGNCIADKDFNTRILVAIYLSNDKMPVYAAELIAASFINDWPNEISDRIEIVKKEYPSFILEDLLPFSTKELSNGINVDRFIQSHFIQPKLFVRIRPGKKVAVLNKLAAAAIDYKIIEENCLAFSNATSLENILKLNEEVVIQDYSSQKVATIFDYISDKGAALRVWDCCAASGGKSILINDSIPNITLTVSDIRASIIANLNERFKRAGIKDFNSFVANALDSKSIPKNKFDIVIADVPCTGSGTWGRTPEYLSTFNKTTIAEFAERQKQIITNIASSMDDKGYLIYITCSCLKAENEEVITYFQDKLPNYTLLHQTILEGYNNYADTMYAAILKRG
jgi:16S rRNA (cytosine967-C5)-methyltransferase